LSLGEQFKHVTALALQDPQATGTVASGLTVMLAFLAVGTAAVLLTRRQQMRRELHG
jgi:hypothetical protein